MTATATTAGTINGNLPSDAVLGDQLVRDVDVYDGTGASRKLTLTFTKTAAGWDVAGADANGANATGALTFDNTGALTGGGTLAIHPLLFVKAVAVAFRQSLHYRIGGIAGL